MIYGLFLAAFGGGILLGFLLGRPREGMLIRQLRKYARGGYDRDVDV